MAPRRRRDYFNTLCAKTIFGIKDQLVVFSALLVSGIISAHAITKFFGSTDTVDWSNPATFASLFNMQVIGGLLMGDDYCASPAVLRVYELQVF